MRAHFTILAALALTSCITDTPAPELMFDDETVGFPDDFQPAATSIAPPPLNLQVDPLVPGQQVIFIASGATPGDQVYFLRSPQLGSTCSRIIGGNCLGLAPPPIVLASATAGASGFAVLTVTLPQDVPLGVTMHFQAAVLGGGGYVSNVSTRVTESVCGDGILHSDEECDDGNVLNGDGCTDICSIDRCGDGILQQGEVCDDGNNTPGDGCSPVCTLSCCVDDFTITVEGGRVTSNRPGTTEAWDDILFIPPFTHPDPYVEVWRGNTLLGTTFVAEDTLNPIWNSSLNITIQQGQALEFRIYDADTFPLISEFMGAFTITWTELNDGRGTGSLLGSSVSVPEFRISVD